ncbi:hypothetical protein [Sphingobium aromaticivastans]|uniref:hypothetical protein n=1 Tax=Sphingobium aromaticivastans TaxID=1778665 RepID=UPI003016EC37
MSADDKHILGALSFAVSIDALPLNRATICILTTVSMTNYHVAWASPQKAGNQVSGSSLCLWNGKKWRCRRRIYVDLGTANVGFLESTILKPPFAKVPILDEKRTAEVLSLLAKAFC